MTSNQRARLVLNPPILIAVLLLTGVALGTGWALLHNKREDAQSSAATTASSDIVLSSDSFDFGNVPAGRAVIRQLLLRNHGESPARLRIEGSDRVVVEPRSLEIAKGQIGRVFLTARNHAAGPWEEELRVVREGSAAQFVVRLRGTNREGSLATSSSPGTNAADVAALAQSARSAGLPTGGGDAASQAAEAAAANPGAEGGDPGSVQISRSTATGAGGPGGVNGGASSQAPALVQLPSGYVPVARSMSERPQTPTSDTPQDGEEAEALPHPKSSDLEKKKDQDPAPGISVLMVSDRSTLNLLGSTNRFYPQQLAILGSPNGGSFTLSSPILFPQIPLGFGQSMQFSQSGAAVGSYDPGSGQVVLSVAVRVIDSNGHNAPLTMQLTTGSVVTRNSSGVLVSLSGEARSAGTGGLRLVGMTKIPDGYSNGAEMELVTVYLDAQLQFASPTSDTSAGSGGQ